MSTFESLLALNVLPVHSAIMEHLLPADIRSLSLVSRSARAFVLANVNNAVAADKERADNWLRVNKPHRCVLSPAGVRGHDRLMVKDSPKFVSDGADAFMVTGSCAVKFSGFKLQSYMDWSDASADVGCELAWEQGENIYVIRSKRVNETKEHFTLSAIRKSDLSLLEEKSLTNLTKRILDSQLKDSTEIHLLWRSSLLGSTFAFNVPNEANRSVLKQGVENVLNLAQHSAAEDDASISIGPNGRVLTFQSSQANLIQYGPNARKRVLWTTRPSPKDTKAMVVKLKTDYVFLMTEEEDIAGGSESRLVKEAEITVLDSRDGNILWKWKVGGEGADARFRVFAFEKFVVITTPETSGRRCLEDVKFIIFDIKKRNVVQVEPDWGMLGTFQGLVGERLMIYTGLRRGKMRLFILDLSDPTTWNAVDWSSMYDNLDIVGVGRDGFVVEERGWFGLKEEMENEVGGEMRPLGKLSFLIMNKTGQMYRTLFSKDNEKSKSNSQLTCKPTASGHPSRAIS